MPESLYRQQKACKPRVEDVLPDVLGEDAGKALAALLRLLTLERHAREAAAIQKRKTGGGQDAQP